MKGIIEEKWKKNSCSEIPENWIENRWVEGKEYIFYEGGFSHLNRNNCQVDQHPNRNFPDKGSKKHWEKNMAAHQKANLIKLRPNTGHIGKKWPLWRTD